MLCPLSLAHLAGVSAFQLAILLLWVDPRLAAVPLLLFLLACLVAPFVPRWSFFLPVTTHGSRKRPQVALSFDDGPDPRTTPRILDLLDRHGVKAAFFLVGRKAEAHPDLVRDILARGHDVGNHGWRHDTLVMLKGRRALQEEVLRAQEVFRSFGVLPRAFRPPVGITSPRLWPILLREGMFCLNFSCRAGDMGNRRLRDLAGRLLRRVRPGDLLLLHDVCPPGGDGDLLLAETGKLLGGLAERSLEVVPPARLVGRAIMARRDEHRGATETFYDDLAETYDHEQFETRVALSRRKELELFRARLPELLPQGGRVLEVGAGTGIFTLELAARASEVEALDLSGNMLARLAAKAKERGVANLVLVEGDAENLALRGPYDLVCSFLAFEYFRDLPAFFQRLAPALRPGARVYFFTARRSFLRFFTQIGNALRQGLWLKARSRREITRMLRRAGVADLRLEGHLLKSWASGGMLWEVEGRWPEGKRDA
jgi:peptidoglycan/xylan/chitin deacetylase (PgdA/CDA1 family)/ubiquinone/menaquinone biosynthesis C-methylase UbiE